MKKHVATALAVTAALMFLGYATAYAQAPVNVQKTSGTNVVTGNLTEGGAGKIITASPSPTLDLLGSTRGSVLYRGASGWSVLTPGTSGYVLRTNGAGADPSWASGGGGGSAVWGDITGTLSNQTDLQTALNARPVTDVKTYGASPSATAADNVTAIQTALSAGGTVYVSQAGVYSLNATLTIPSNTTLICAPGVTFSKASAYGEVIMNAGAPTQTTNSNIAIIGLTIATNGYGGAGTNVYGLRGQLGFSFAQNVIIRDFICLDLEDTMFGIHMAGGWVNAYFENLLIYGEKDAVHYGPGSQGGGFYWVTKTADDAVALNAKDYVDINTQLGDIDNIYINNLYDLNGTSATGNTVRLLTGSWQNYANGMSVRRGDTCVNNGRIYRVANAAGTGPFTTSVAPTQSSGSVTGADGVTWLFIQNGTFLSCNIHNVHFDTVYAFEDRPIFSTPWELDTFERSVYPGTEDESEITGLYISNVYDQRPAAGMFLGGAANLLDFSITNSYISTTSNFLAFSGDDRGAHTVVGLVNGNTFAAMPTSAGVTLTRPNLKLVLTGVGNSSVGQFTISTSGSGSSVRAPLLDLPVLSSSLSTSSAATGDRVKEYNSLWSQFNGTAWIPTSPQALATIDTPRFAGLGVKLTYDATSGNPYLQVEGNGGTATGFFGGGNSDTVPWMASSSTRAWSADTGGFAFFQRATDGHMRLVRRNGSTTNQDVLNINRSTGEARFYDSLRGLRMGVGLSPDTDAGTPYLQVEGYGGTATGFFGGGNSDTIPVWGAGSARTWTDSVGGFAAMYRATEGDFRLVRRNGSTSDADVLNIARSSGAGTWYGAWATSGNITSNGTITPKADTSVTTAAAGQMAFDTTAWAAARGAIQVNDGTSDTFVVAALASDSPSNGQVPTWNTGGTITWETPATGNVTASGTLASGNIVVGGGTTVVSTTSTGAGVVTAAGYATNVPGGLVAYAPPSNGTDDTSTIQALLNANSVLLFGAGTWIIDSLSLNSGQFIRGIGNASILKKKAATTGYILNAGTNVVTVMNLALDGSGASTYKAVSTIGTVHGLYLWADGAATAQNLYCYNFDGAGVYMIGDTNTTNRLNRGLVAFCTFDNCQTGIRLGDSNAAEYTRVEGNKARGSYYGLLIPSANVTVVGNDFSDCTWGWYSKSATQRSHSLFVGNTVHHSAVAFYNAMTGASVIGNNFLGATAVSLLADGVPTPTCKGVIFRSNNFESCTVSDYSNGENLFEGNTLSGTFTHSGSARHSVYRNNKVNTGNWQPDIAKEKDLTESTATTFANVALASGKSIGIEMSVMVNANDATDYQALTTNLKIQAVNKAGTVTATVDVVAGTTAASSGTLTATFTVVASGNSFDIKADATSSLTQTVLQARFAVTAINSNGTASVITAQ